MSEDKKTYIYWLGGPPVDLRQKIREGMNCVHIDWDGLRLEQQRGWRARFKWWFCGGKRWLKND